MFTKIAKSALIAITVGATLGSAAASGRYRCFPVRRALHTNGRHGRIWGQLFRWHSTLRCRRSMPRGA